MDPDDDMHSRREVFNDGNFGDGFRPFTLDDSELSKELHLPNTGQIPSPADARLREYSMLPLRQFQARPMVRHEEARTRMDTTDDPGEATSNSPVEEPPVANDFPYWSDVDELNGD